MGITMDTNRSKSTANNTLQVQRKNQKSPQEEFGAEVNHDPALADEKRKAIKNERQSERTAWN